MMWLFAILGSLGLVFMLYVLVQFFREGKRKTSNGQHSSNPNTGKPQTGRVVSMDSVQAKAFFFQKTHRRMESW